jgi:NTP pyrophosphatase (non-canonical NTP hydrolase)
MTQIQAAIAKIEEEKGWTNTPDEKMTFISEELGEIAKWVRRSRKNGLAQAELQELNLEIADVLQHIISLANYFGLNIEEGLVEKKGLLHKEVVEP